jgi:hypothetical protein
MDYNQMRNCVKGNPEIVNRWIDICDKAENSEKLWIEHLREKGFKASHPNDGWVDRENHEVYFAYPQFNDGADVGDLVMLGWSDDKKSERPIRLIGKRELLLTYYKFEDA